MYDLLMALTGSGHGLCIIQVPPRQFDSQLFEESIVTGGADESPYRRPTASQILTQVVAQKASGTGY
jgi:hypothetical protein